MNKPLKHNWEEKLGSDLHSSSFKLKKLFKNSVCKSFHILRITIISYFPSFNLLPHHWEENKPLYLHKYTVKSLTNQKQSGCVSYL